MSIDRRAGKCDIFSGDPQRVEQARLNTMSAVAVQRLAAIFKVLGEPTRIRIVDALSKGELCVCDLALLLAMSSSAVSHQLRVLRDAGLVKYRKEGKSAIYSLDDTHVLLLFKQGLAHVEHISGEAKGGGNR